MRFRVAFRVLLPRGRTHDVLNQAAGGCVSLATIPPEDDDAAMDVIEASWVWMVHPFQAAGVICWHVTAVIPASDVLDMAAALNAREVTS